MNENDEKRIVGLAVQELAGDHYYRRRLQANGNAVILIEGNVVEFNHIKSLTRGPVLVARIGTERYEV